VEGTALVQNGPGLRQVVTTDMDLRDAKLVFENKYFISVKVKARCTG
jgi:hypothetical protein